MSSNEQPQVISYTFLRRTLGILGVSLPIVLILGSIIIGDCHEVQSSISNYYHTKMRNVFVGFLFALSLFLWTYKGYSSSKWDNRLGNISCFLGLGVVFFPTAVTQAELTTCISSISDNGIVGVLHLIFAASFFICLAFFSISIFTKGVTQATTQKIKRNLLYKICGYAMLVNIAIMAIYVVFLRKPYPNLEQYSPVFWLEAISLWAFGLSWLTKGGLLFKDA